MELRYMTPEERDFVLSLDRHADDAAIAARVQSKTGYVLWADGHPVGVMHYCMLWDTMPFLNLLFVKEEERHKGYGTQAMTLWEADMKARGARMVLLSTQADEDAQHLYRRLGYVDCGGLLFTGTPFDQPTELFFRKVL